MVAAQPQIEIIPENAQNIGGRHEQQDSFGFSDPSDSSFVTHGGLLAVVADGMGGMAQGGMASKTAVTAFLSSYMMKPEGESIPAALSNALGQASSAVIRLAGENGLPDEIGTTLVAAVVLGRRLYWISVGDSRLYLIRGGEVTQLTIDHVYADELDKEVAAGLISKAEAAEHPERDHLTSYLGKVEMGGIDRSLRGFPLEPGDRLILCSDGLYKGLCDREIAEIVEKADFSTAERLVGAALAKRLPNQDNVTVLTLTLPVPPPLALESRLEVASGTAPFPSPRRTILQLAFVALTLLAIGTALLWWLDPFHLGHNQSGRPAERVTHSPGDTGENAPGDNAPVPVPGVDLPAPQGSPSPLPHTEKEKQQQKSRSARSKEAGPDKGAPANQKPDQ